jgi:hypothetical protein
VTRKPRWRGEIAFPFESGVTARDRMTHERDKIPRGNHFTAAHALQYTVS